MSYYKKEGKIYFQKAASNIGINPSSSANDRLSTDLKNALLNFSNPYVELLLVCKVCKKEQSMKQSHHFWKRHYLSHLDESELPYRCIVCNKGHTTKSNLQRHMKHHTKTE